MPLYATGSGREGIVHVIGPELGLTQPGMTIVCGDSHTSTHGAFGALAFGDRHVRGRARARDADAAAARPKTMRVRVRRRPAAGRDGEGHDPRRDRPARRRRRRRPRARVRRRRRSAALSMESRMTVCNMSIEAGARAGMIAPDDTTFAYLEGRPAAPTGADWEQALDGWRALASDPERHLRPRVRDRRRRARAAGHVGHEPGHGRAGHGARARPRRARRPRPARRRPSGRSPTWASSRARRSQDIPVDRVFIGSCTNARIEDLRAAAAVVAGKQVDPRVRALVVPGSATVKRQAEDEGLDRIFLDAGLRVAPGRLLDVPRHEPRHPRAGRALRLDVEPQLRGPAGTRRPHPPRQPADGRRGGDRRPLRRHPRELATTA